MKKKVLIYIITPLFLIISSCGSGGAKHLDKADLFSISLGKLADEIDYFQRDSMRFSPDNGMVMKNGFFYVTNGRSGKFLKFNSYGDLLTLIYNPDRNPYPAELFSRKSDDAEVNRRVIPWQFNSPGALAVSDDRIYIVDKVAPNRQVQEKEVLMDRSILQFSSEGDYINFIGMEGTGGQPFPYIENIWISEKSELIVLYRTRASSGESWYMNWYTPSGSLRYSVEIRESAIPMPAGEENLSVSIDNVIPDIDRYVIYIKMTYFREKERDIKEIFGGTLDYSVTENSWSGWKRLPENENLIDGMKIDSPYSLIGVRKGYQFFVSLGSDNDYVLLIRDREGRFQEEQILSLDEGGIIDNRFYLSGEGILSAMVFREDRADILWWRTDRLLGDKGNG